MNNTHEELAYFIAKEFVTEQSEGEWDEKTIHKDAKALEKVMNDYSNSQNATLLTRNAELEKTVEGLMQNTASQKQTFDALAKKYAELEAENKGLRDRVLEEAAVICEGWRLVNGQTVADTLRGMKEENNGN